MSIRTQRVAKLVQREVADLLSNEFGDQLQTMVTVTDARVTKDLSIAYLYVSVFGSTSVQRQDTFRRLEDLAPQVRQALAGRTRHQLRTVPQLRFFLDESLEKAAHMEDLFSRIREERARRGEDDADADA